MKKQLGREKHDRKDGQKDGEFNELPELLTLGAQEPPARRFLSSSSSSAFRLLAWACKYSSRGADGVPSEFVPAMGLKPARKLSTVVRYSPLRYFFSATVALPLVVIALLIADGYDFSPIVADLRLRAQGLPVTCNTLPPEVSARIQKCIDSEIR